MHLCSSRAVQTSSTAFLHSAGNSDRFREPGTMRASGLKRPRAHYYRVRSGPQQPHNEPVFFVRVTDLSSFRLTRQIETHDTVECRYEVCYAIGTRFRSGWKGKTSVLSCAKTFGEGCSRRLSGLSCEQRANRLHSKKSTSIRKFLRHDSALVCRWASEGEFHARWVLENLI
jgi:hypothetical protein